MNMTKETQSNLQLIAAWCGFWYIVVVLIGWGLVAGFLPPIHPSAPQSAIATTFMSDYFRIRFGMILTMFAALVFIPFTAVLCQYLARIEGRVGILSFSALLGGAATMCLTFYPALWWLIAAYRPGRPPEIVYLLDDVAWLQFLGGVSIYLAMPLSVIVAAFCDTSAEPVFPRWVGYANIWLILILIPDQLLFFFYTGPFAWSGLFGFWLPLLGFGGWPPFTFYFLRKAVLRDRQRMNIAAAAPDAGPSALPAT
jgi:hypothetical protein